MGISFRHNSMGPLLLFLFLSQGFYLDQRTRSEERQAKGSYSVQFSNVSPKVYTRGQKFVTSLAPELVSRFCRSFLSPGKRFPSPAWRPSWPWRVPSSAIQLAIRHLPSRRGRHSRRAKGGPSVEREWVRFSSAPPAAHRARLSWDFSADSAGISRNPDS